MIQPGHRPRFTTTTLRRTWRKKAQQDGAQQEMGLPAGCALQGIVSPGGPKGLDLIADISRDLMERPMRLVVLGTGDAYYEYVPGTA